MNVAYNVDCMEYMRTLPEKAFDLAVVDPPYRDQKENQPTKDMRKNGEMSCFGDRPKKEFFDELFAAGGAVSCVYGWDGVYQMPQLISF